MNKIIIKSPTRVDLAGGTLDLWPLYNFINGAVTVNIAIDIYTEVQIEPLQTRQIILESEDLGVKSVYDNISDCLNHNDEKLLLLKTQLKYWHPEMGFHLKTSSQSPVGGGLGGSSSLTISLLKAFALLTRRPFSSIDQMVKIAHNIESQILNTPTGTQDYYPAASGGLNIIKYSFDGIEQQVIESGLDDISNNFLLVYTGKPHHSGLNNFEVVKAAVTKDVNTISALCLLKDISERMAEVCFKKEWQKLPALFKSEYAARLKLAPTFSSPEIEELNLLSLQSGAEAVKICGAGGGGCVLVWVDPSKKEKVTVACQKAGFKVLNAKPVGALSPQ